MAHTLFIESVAFWSPRMPGWDIARAAFASDGPMLAEPAPRPASQLLAPTERRRAPDTVALALEVAACAVRDAGLQAAEMPSVFVSAHGDLAITDCMCATLAETPLLVSPTRFHNSVHNAPAGYWTIATGCTRASTALSAFEQSFAAGLLEAASQSLTDGDPLLLVGVDIEAKGALACVTRSRGLLAAAMVLSPLRTERSLATLEWSLRQGPAQGIELRSAAARSLAQNAMADALPLMEAIASERNESLLMPLSSRLSLQIRIGPL